MMKAIIILDGTPEEIAVLVVGLQGRQDAELRDPMEGLPISHPATS